VLFNLYWLLKFAGQHLGATNEAINDVTQNIALPEEKESNETRIIPSHHQSVKNQGQEEESENGGSRNGPEDEDKTQGSEHGPESAAPTEEGQIEIYQTAAVFEPVSEKPPELLVNFLTFAAYLLPDMRDQRQVQYGRLCLDMLLRFVQNMKINKMLHNPNLSIDFPIYRKVCYHHLPVSVFDEGITHFVL